MELEKIYTQEDMDNITSKVKESTLAKIEKTHISMDAYKELETKYNNLLTSQKTNEIRQTFLSHNGNEKAFDDFMNSHKNLLEMDSKEISNSMSKIAQEKAFYFNNTLNVPNEDEITKDMFKQVFDTSDIIEGTLMSSKQYYK